MHSICVFVVDDDFLISLTVENALMDAGFHPHTAHSAANALALFENGGHACAALVTDVNLGEAITGWDIARAARRKFPSLPVVYVTGDSAGQWEENGVRDSILITKPFSPSQVVLAVAEMLDQRRA